MLVKTPGIVLHSIKYSETSIICKIFTEALGLQSYLVQGVRSASKTNKAALFRPLSLLELVVYNKKESKGLHRIKEFNRGYVYTDLPFNIRKSTQALFVSEVLYHCIKEGEHDPEMYQFITDWLVQLDQTTDKVANYHLIFMAELSAHLGFRPEGTYSDTTQLFDIIQGQFVPIPPNHHHYLDVKQSRHLSEMLKGNWQHPMNGAERGILLEQLIDFFRYHIDGFPELRSHKILKEVMS